MVLRQRQSLGLVWIGVCAVAAAHVLWLPRIVVDDAFISFRYARNFLEGRGLVFNPGEAVEGYSNLLWVLMTSVGLWFRPDPEGITRAMGVIAALGSICFGTAIIRRLADSHVAALAGGLVLALSTAFCSSAVNGLETGLFGFWITASLFCALVRRPILASLLMGLATLTRPEGLAVGLCLGVLGMWTGRRDGWVRGAIRWLGPCLAIGLMVTAIRWAYYGELLPNSVAAKSSLPFLLARAPLSTWPLMIFNRPGIEYVSGFIRSSIGIWMVLAIVPLLGKGARRNDAAMLLAPPALGMLICITNFGDWMASYRLLTPYLPVLTAAVVWGASEAVDRLRRRPLRSVRRLRGGLVLCVASLWMRNGFQTERPYVPTNPDAELAWTLRASHQPGLLAATDVLGRLGYYAGYIPIVDMAGLTDAHIARRGEPRPPLGRSDFGYVLSRKPHLIMNNVRAAWQRHLAHAELRDEYLWMDRPAWTRGEEWGGVPRFVFVRRGTTLEQEMRRRYRDAQWRRPEEVVTRG